MSLIARLVARLPEPYQKAWTYLHEDEEYIDHERVKALTWGIVGLSVVNISASSYLAPFADPSSLALIGNLAGASIIFFYMSSTSGQRFGKYAALTASAVLFLMAGFHFAVVREHASAISRENDKRCEALQSDMLSADPRRADSPALFEAFKCRPSGGSVHALPTAAMIDVHEWLPWGGVPAR